MQLRTVVAGRTVKTLEPRTSSEGLAGITHIERVSADIHTFCTRDNARDKELALRHGTLLVGVPGLRLCPCNDTLCRLRIPSLHDQVPRRPLRPLRRTGLASHFTALSGLWQNVVSPLVPHLGTAQDGTCRKRCSHDAVCHGVLVGPAPFPRASAVASLFPACTLSHHKQRTAAQSDRPA